MNPRAKFLLGGMFCLVPWSLTSSQELIDSSTISVEAGSVFDDSGTFDAENLLDEEVEEGARDAHLGTHWIAAEGTFTDTVTFDLGAAYDLAQLRILNTSNSGWNDSETDTFTVALSTDDGATYSDPSEPIRLLDFSEGEQTVVILESGITNVQLEVTNEDLDDQGTNDVRVGLNEVQFFSGVDSDDDGMLDAWEEAQFGDLSKDGTEDEDLPKPDGLTNKEEHDIGTNPKVSDTDEDTLTDGDEVNIFGTNPLVAEVNDGEEIDSGEVTAVAGSVFNDSGTFDASNLLDGETNEGNRDAHLGTHWIAAEGMFTETVTFDLGSNYDLTGLDILNTSNSGWNDSETDTFTIATSTDGENFSDPSAAITAVDFSEGTQSIPFAVENITHVRLVVSNDDADDQESDDVRVGLNEVQFLGNPGPAPGILIDPETITAEADSTYNDSGTFDASNLLDGETNEGNQDAHQGTHWIALDGTYTEIVTFDLGGSYDLTKLSILNTSNSGWNDSETDRFTVATSGDGGGSFSAPGDEIELQDFLEGAQEVPLGISGVTHVRLEVTNDNLEADARVGLNEVMFFQNPAADSDGDGMIDSWELEHFGDLTRDGTEDEDEPAPDGLTNKQEHDKRTDPKDPDSDDDMLTDGDEVNTYMTNPNASDTDGDTLSDGAEVLTHMSNPTLFDSDGDSLSDGDEVNIYNTRPDVADSDGDGQDDGFEIALGSDPNSAASKADVVVTTAVFTGADDEGLDFEGEFLYAVNASSLGEAGQVGDAYFTDELSTDGYTIDAVNDIPAWGGEMDFGDGDDNDNLEMVMSGIRWSPAPTGVLLTMENLEPGRRYKLQTLHAERCCDRGWNTFINGARVVRDFNAGRLQLGDLDNPAGDAGGESGAVVAIEFIATSATLEVELNGADVPFADGNAILNGVTLEVLSSSIPFAISSIVKDSGEVTLTWNSSPGREYAVEYKDDLAAAVWQELDDGVVSEGAETAFTDDAPARTGAAIGWYRVRIN
ncbi:MAG: hypothetical protein ACI9R3_001396 [Verrucomicrobiales bacterium]